MTIDVNAAFTTERASQIAAAREANATFDRRIAEGKLVNLGDGRYRVNQPGSWDHGEILTRRQGMILPEHGLHVNETGQAALYSAVPAWHGLGQVIPEGTSDIDKVLELAHLDFTVDTTPVTFTPNGTQAPLEFADQFVTYRTDTNSPLGVVGKVYAGGGVIQNRAAFEFLQALTGDFGVKWESAGMLRGGQRTFISLRLPESVTIDPQGINDEIVPFIVALNSFDGRTPFRVIATPWRPVCANTERFALRDAYTSWSVRHSRNALNQFEDARATLGLSVKYYEALTAELTSLAQAELALNEFHAVIDELWEPVDRDKAVTPQGKAAITREENRRAKLAAMFTTEAERLGRTAYAAERVFTDYLDHEVPVRVGKSPNLAAARATAILEGNQDDKKTVAHKRLLTLVRR